MKHIWIGGMTPSTPDFPPEGYSYCANCGLEETDTDRDDTECPYDHEAFEATQENKEAS